MSERDLMDWAMENDSTLYLSMSYCCTYDEMREVLNKATGLGIEPNADLEEAFAAYLQVLKDKPEQRPGL